ncbi:c-type cytochrome [Dyella subtropica]|uniref:c-type cytochrome n=1 Tax=Dyella subtropica TaxID=2992127 RepID=UPI002255CC94|nr:c-type cytochrome [Dyella subtropica]
MSARWAFLFTLAGLSMAGSACAGSPDGATLATQGNGRGAAPCAACHGADGGGQTASGYPRLAGLPAEYLRKQLEDFASGIRGNAVMQPVATALNADERATLTAYYASLQPPPAAPTTASSSAGPVLADRGRWPQGLPACDQCHGPGGVGVGNSFPPLAAQPASYLANQLRAWQHGTRKNDPLELMRGVAAKLSAADIDAVTAWYAAQSVAAQGVKP